MIFNILNVMRFLRNIYTFLLIFIQVILILDHFQGLTNSFKAGLIYCSPKTKKVLSMKYPRIQDKIHALELNIEHTLILNKVKIK